MHFNPAFCMNQGLFCAQLDLATTDTNVSEEDVAQFVENNSDWIEDLARDNAAVKDKLEALAGRVSVVRDRISALLQITSLDTDICAKLGVSPYPTQNWKQLSLEERVSIINSRRLPIVNLVDYTTADAATAFVSSCKGLTFLDVRGYELSDQQLVSMLAAHPLVQSVMVSSTRITGQGLEEVCSHCRALDTLILSCPGLIHMPRVATVSHLVLANSALVQIDCTSMPALQSIVLSGSRMLKQLTHLDALSKVKELGLDGCECLESLDLSSLRSLERLHLGHTRLGSITGLEHLSALQELNLTGSKLDPQLLRSFTHARIITE